MSDNDETEELPPPTQARKKYAIEGKSEGSWLSDGREEYRRLLENEPEYHEVLREEYPYNYWAWEFTPEPPEEVVEKLGLDK